jgi:hypothetical protein
MMSEAKSLRPRLARAVAHKLAAALVTGIVGASAVTAYAHHSFAAQYDSSNHANARRVTRSSTGEVLGAASSAGQTLTGPGAGSGQPPRPAPGGSTQAIGSQQPAPAGTR